MPGPASRRVDLTRLPALARYALALVILIAVAALALTAAGGHSATKPAGWYTIAVRASIFWKNPPKASPWLGIFPLAVLGGNW